MDGSLSAGEGRGVYDSIGSELAPKAVGAAVTTFEGADAAFTAYLDQYCPA